MVNLGLPIDVGGSGKLRPLPCQGFMMQMFIEMCTLTARIVTSPGLGQQLAMYCFWSPARVCNNVCNSITIFASEQQYSTKKLSYRTYVGGETP